MATEIPLPFFPAEAQEENHEPLTFDILHSTDESPNDFGKNH
ncbi:hypothetical protein [Salmonella enterica]|nr:hypothetical protein [Salmonella enterica]